MQGKIAFFDSGIGGLTVLYEAMQALPKEQYIYFSDAENAPYGTKSTRQIIALVEDAVAFLAKKEIKVLVLACNTATSVVATTLRARYSFPIIGMEPAVKPALKQVSNKKVLVCATDKTLKETKLSHLIQHLNAESKVDKLSLQKLVLFAESGLFEGQKVRKYLQNAFRTVNWDDYDALVLGCTHFLYYKKLIKEIVADSVTIVDGHVGTVQELIRRLPTEEYAFKNSLDFYVSKKRKAPELLAPYFERIRPDK